MYTLCILDVQPGFEEAEQILGPVRDLLEQAVRDKAFIVLGLFKKCGEIDWSIRACKVWHTKRDRVSAIRKVLPDTEVRVAGLYTDLFLKDLVKGLSRDFPVTVMSQACYGDKRALDTMRLYRNVTIVP